MFEYLNNHVYGRGGEDILFNMFYPLSLEDIIKAELSLKMKLPSELRQFYLEIGYGELTAPKDRPDSYRFFNSNKILHPAVVARFYHGQLLNEDYECYMSEDTYELLEPGDIPVFEIGDSSSFMIMKPQSENPNAVWLDDSVVKIEDSFERFIWRLYHEDPGYYGTIIQNYIKDNPS